LRDIVAVSVDKEAQYVDVLIVATARSVRHLVAAAEFINKAYKRKTAHAKGLNLEGRKDPSSGWIATDLGNIALHLFTETARSRYDVEALWALGTECDTKAEEESSHAAAWGSDVLADLKPANT